MRVKEKEKNQEKWQGKLKAIQLDEGAVGAKWGTTEEPGIEECFGISLILHASLAPLALICP